MGSTAGSAIADALFPRVRQRVLGLLFMNPQRSFFSNEVVALAQSGTGAVQRELAALSEAGLLLVTLLGNQKHYQANEQAPVFQELRGLVLKTLGLVDVLRGTLAPVAERIDAAFVYGSIARQQDTATSDVDLLVLSESVDYGALFAALEPAIAALGRPINPTVYTVPEWARRLKQKNAFVVKVLQQPKLWVIGSDEALHAIAA